MVWHRFQATSRFADGQIQALQVGGVVTSKSYDGFGRAATIQTGAGGHLQNASHGFGNNASAALSASGPRLSGSFAFATQDR